MTNPSKPHGRADLMVDLATGDSQCTARSKGTGKRCRKAAMLGGNVCQTHGGAAPQTRAKAQRRLQQAADVLVQRLLQFALDGDVADPVALQAIRDALDRAGMKPGIDVDVTLKPYHSIFEDLESGSRAAFRGEPEPEPQRALPVADDGVLDVEIVADDEDAWPMPEPQPEPYDGAQGYSEPSPFAPVNPPPEAGLMPFDSAVSAAAAMRRNVVQHTAIRNRP
jgi:hypothetical protein